MSMTFGERRQWGAADVVLYLVGVAGLAASLTIAFLGMRAVLDVGGYCAEGGPYVIGQHCPDGVALLLPLSIFAGRISHQLTDASLEGPTTASRARASRRSSRPLTDASLEGPTTASRARASRRWSRPLTE